MPAPSRLSRLAKLFLLLAVACLCEESPTVHAVPPRESTGIEIDARASKTEFAQLIPIEIFIDVANRSDAVYLIKPEREPNERFAITVLRDGKLASKTRYGLYREENPRLGASGKATFLIYPSKQYTTKYYVNLFFDMTQPGIYEIIIGLECENRKTSKKELVKAKPIRVEVLEKKRERGLELFPTEVKVSGPFSAFEADVMDLAHESYPVDSLDVHLVEWARPPLSRCLQTIAKKRLTAKNRFI